MVYSRRNLGQGNGAAAVLSRAVENTRGVAVASVRLISPETLLATVPAPLNALNVGLRPFKSSTPSTFTLPMPGPGSWGIAATLPSCKVPAETFVKPL